MSFTIHSSVPIGAAIRLRPWLAQAVVVAGLTVGFAAGFVGHGEGSAAADPDLTRLLRAMAALKLLFAAAAAAAMIWRLRSPIGPPRLTLYALAAGAMAAGPGLIWTMTHVALGAAMLHLGLLAALLLLYRDPETRLRLAAAIARRQAGASAAPPPPATAASPGPSASSAAR